MRFPGRTFTVQRLDGEDPNYAKFNCGKDKKPKLNAEANEYGVAACYRYDNAHNLLGWVQGWCFEKYLEDGTVHVTCESEKNFQPKIGFNPGGYFYSYGRGYNLTEGEPFIRIGYTETGRCSKFRVGYLKRFKAGSRDTYYAPSKQ